MLNPENTGMVKVTFRKGRRRKVGRDVSKLITFTARCQRCYKPNEVNDRSEDMFKVTNINTKKNSVSY